MQGWQSERGTTFEYNSDFNGDVIITDSQGNRVVVPAQDLLDLVAWAYVVPQKIMRLQECSTDELLLGMLSGSKNKPLTSR